MAAKLRLGTVFVVMLATLAGCAGSQEAPDNFSPAEIVGMEQAALERWGKGDPDGYFEIMADDIRYFDPTIEKRIDGLDALKKLIEPFRGKISIERAEMIGPSVQRDGDTAILTFNLVSHGGQFAGGPKSDVRWNSTEIYRRIDGRWRIVHSHWSYTRPELVKPAGP